jgi:hypothetical protein
MVYLIVEFVFFICGGLTLFATFKMWKVINLDRKPEERVAFYGPFSSTLRPVIAYLKRYGTDGLACLWIIGTSLGVASGIALVSSHR